MFEMTRKKRSRAYGLVFVCFMVLVCLLCMPQKALASTIYVCHPDHRAALGLGVDRTDVSTYFDHGSRVSNLKLTVCKDTFSENVRLTFDSKTGSGFGIWLNAGFTLAVADSTGNVLGKYYDHVWCYLNSSHWLDFKPSDCTQGDANAIQRFCDDYLNHGGANYQIYVYGLSVSEDNSAPDADWGIEQHPTDQTVTAGQSATFTIQAVGDDLSYQWHIDRNDGKGWQEIDGANKAEYVTSVTDASCDGFGYFCKVTNPDGGEMDSAVAVLHVVTAPETGDSSRPDLWLTILLTSVLAILILCKKAKN